LPFMISRLPDDLKSKIELVSFIGLSHEIDFEIHLSNWLGGASSKNALPTEPEVRKLTGIKMLCFYGQEDSEVLCNDLTPDILKPIELPGGHLVKERFEPIVSAILSEIKQ
jgi:type IV secretory pathway VirJ component